MDGMAGRWVTVGVPGDDVQIALMTADESYYDENIRALLETKRGTERITRFQLATARRASRRLNHEGSISHDRYASTRGEQKRCSPIHSETSSASLKL